MRRSRFGCTADHTATPRRHCKECDAKRKRDHYQRNRQALLARQKARRASAIVREVAR